MPRPLTLDRINELLGNETAALVNGTANGHPPPTQKPPDITSPKTPEILRMSDVQPTEVQWLWDKRIALGKLTLLCADPGEGKSFLSLDFAARVSTGAKWPDGAGYAPQGGVVLLTNEDDLSDTVRPRLDAACADCTRINALKSVLSKDEDGDYGRDVDLKRDLDVIDQAIVKTPDCKLLVIDCINSYVGDTDTHKNADVRRVLTPLSQMAAKHGIAVVGIHHFRKGEGSAKHRVGGSLAFIATARAAWTVAPDKTDPTGNRKLFLCIKNNIGPTQSGLAFEMTARHGDSTVPCIEWISGEVTISADEALAAPKGKPGPEANDQQDAEAFLRDALANGARLSKELTADAQEGHGIAPRTLSRARKSLGVEAFRESPTGPWMARLPHCQPTMPTDPYL